LLCHLCQTQSLARSATVDSDAGRGTDVNNSTATLQVGDEHPTTKSSTKPQSTNNPDVDDTRKLPFQSLSVSEYEEYCYRLPDSDLFRCIRCDFTYRFPSKVRRHFFYRHSAVPPYRCGHCSYGAKERSKVVKHSRAIHRHVEPVVLTEAEDDVVGRGGCDEDDSRSTQTQQNTDDDRGNNEDDVDCYEKDDQRTTRSHFGRFGGQCNRKRRNVSVKSPKKTRTAEASSLGFPDVSIVTAAVENSATCRDAKNDHLPAAALFASQTGQSPCNDGIAAEDHDSQMTECDEQQTISDNQMNDIAHKDGSLQPRESRDHSPIPCETIFAIHRFSYRPGQVHDKVASVVVKAEPVDPDEEQSHWTSASERSQTALNDNDDLESRQHRQLENHFRCAYCDAKSRYGRRDLRLHVFSIHMSLRMYGCSQCEFGHNTDRSRVRDHCRRCHSDIEASLVDNADLFDAVKVVDSVDGAQRIAFVRPDDGRPVMTMTELAQYFSKETSVRDAKSDINLLKSSSTRFTLEENLVERLVSEEATLSAAGQNGGSHVTSSSSPLPIDTSTNASDSRDREGNGHSVIEMKSVERQVEFCDDIGGDTVAYSSQSIDLATSGDALTSSEIRLLQSREYERTLGAAVVGEIDERSNTPVVLEPAPCLDRQLRREELSSDTEIRTVYLDGDISDKEVTQTSVDRATACREPAGSANRTLPSPSATSVADTITLSGAASLGAEDTTTSDSSFESSNSQTQPATGAPSRVAFTQLQTRFSQADIDGAPTSSRNVLDSESTFTLHPSGVAEDDGSIAEPLSVTGIEGRVRDAVPQTADAEGLDSDKTDGKRTDAPGRSEAPFSFHACSDTPSVGENECRQSDDRGAAGVTGDVAFVESTSADGNSHVASPISSSGNFEGGAAPTDFNDSNDKVTTMSSEDRVTVDCADRKTNVLTKASSIRSSIRHNSTEEDEEPAPVLEIEPQFEITRNRLAPASIFDAPVLAAEPELFPPKASAIVDDGALKRVASVDTLDDAVISDNDLPPVLEVEQMTCDEFGDTADDNRRGSSESSSDVVRSATDKDGGDTEGTVSSPDGDVVTPAAHPASAKGQRQRRRPRRSVRRNWR
jgi:hypothetical protein